MIGFHVNRFSLIFPMCVGRTLIAVDGLYFGVNMDDYTNYTTILK